MFGVKANAAESTKDIQSVNPIEYKYTEEKPKTYDIASPAPTAEFSPMETVNEAAKDGAIWFVKNNFITIVIIAGLLITLVVVRKKRRDMGYKEKPKM